jgi:hypothetical protein
MVKYSRCLFPNDPSRMILDNVDELICQNLTEHLQTDIDGSIEFSLNTITVQSLEKYLKTLYMPPLDIDQISSVWDQILPNPKTKDNVIEEVWEIARKATIIPFSIFTTMFHQCFAEHRFLESTLELLQQFHLQVKSIALDYKVFPGDQSKFSLNCLCCGKKITPTELIGKVLFMAPIAISHHLKILSSIPPVNDSWLIFKNMPVLFTSTHKKSASKTLFDNAIYEIAEDDVDELFHSKNRCTNHDCRIGEYFFCEAIKVDLAESEDKRKKNISRKRRISFQAHSQALCVCFAHYLKI